MTALGVLRHRAGQFLARRYPSGLIRYGLYTQNRHYEPELWLVPKIVPRSDVAVDVGGNMGVWCLQMARFARAVECFEPNPACIGTLEHLLPRRATRRMAPAAIMHQIRSTRPAATRVARLAGDMEPSLASRAATVSSTPISSMVDGAS